MTDSVKLLQRFQVLHVSLPHLSCIIRAEYKVVQNRKLLKVRILFYFSCLKQQSNNKYNKLQCPETELRMRMSYYSS